MEEINKKEEALQKVEKTDTENKEEVNTQELRATIDKLDKEINEKSEILAKTREDIEKDKEKIPQVDYRREMRGYEVFCVSLGDYNQKLNTLKELQSELSNKFIDNKDEGQKAQFEMQIRALNDLITDLENRKSTDFGTDNREWNEQQFKNRSIEVIPRLSLLNESLKKLSKDYVEYLQEREGNLEQKKTIEQDPKTIDINNVVSQKTEYANKISNEMGQLQSEKAKIYSQISKLENNAQ